MATTVRRTAYFSMKTPNRAGQGARLLNALAAHKVNLLAFTGFPNAGRAQVDFIPYDAAKFTRAARKLGMKLSRKKTVFLAQGGDKAGAVAAICGKLARAGVTILAGSDAPNPGTTWGASLHQELQLLVEAGLPAADVLSGATARAASRFGFADRGRIAPGLRADLVQVHMAELPDGGRQAVVRGVWREGQRVL